MGLLNTPNILTVFDGLCDQTKELQRLDTSMSNDVKWIISSSGRYMFVRFEVNTLLSTSKGFLAKIHYGNEILVQRGNKKYSLNWPYQLTNK